MNRFWYVVQNLNNKKHKEYLIGFLFGNKEADETQIMDSVNEWCKEKNFRLALLIQAFPMLPILNQVFPFVPTDESAACLEHVIQAISDNQ